MPVTIGEVTTFANVQADKAQALKVLEEAAEVFGAWQVYDDSYEGVGSASDEWVRNDLVDEIADTIQACANLAAAIGVDDMREAMSACEARNRERGRL